MQRSAAAMTGAECKVNPGEVCVAEADDALTVH